MNKTKKYALAGIAALLLAAGASYYSPAAPVASAAQNYTPVETQYFSLSGSGIGITGATLPLTKFQLPNGTPLSMSNFGVIGYGVIEPGAPKEEQVSFTGVTQNANGSATLTGVTRGLQFVYPYTSSSTDIYTHAGGTTFVITNSAAFYSQFASPLNSITVTQPWTFGSTTPPGYDSNPVWTNFASTTFASIAYVNQTATSGAANASETVNGISQLATASQAASSTSLGSTGGRLALPSSLATSTCSAATTSVIVSSGATGKIAAGCIDQSASYSWTGNQTFAASSTYSLVPPGSIEAYATTSAPYGWLLTDGASYATSTFPNLFSVIGYGYGGNGTSTFAVPNTQGRFLYAYGSSTTSTAGAKGGATSTTLSQANVPSYNLSAPANGSTGSGGTGFFDTSNSGSGTQNLPSGGSGTPVPILPPYIVLNYIIKY